MAYLHRLRDSKLIVEDCCDYLHNTYQGVPWTNSCLDYILFPLENKDG